jgi:hypothetical protein
MRIERRRNTHYWELGTSADHFFLQREGKGFAIVKVKKRLSPARREGGQPHIRE